MPRAPVLLSSPCLLLAVLAAPLPAAAQGVQRCMDGSGRTVFTDQRCADIGATARVPPSLDGAASGAGARPRGPLPGGCPRTAAQLAGELGTALRAGDSNRLAGLYDWSGVRGPAASRVLDQLERIATRPLLDIAPVLAEAAHPAAAMPAPPLPPPHTDAAAPATSGSAATAGREGPARWLPGWMRMTPGGTGETRANAPADTPVTTAAVPLAAAVTPAPVPPPRAVALRVEQTLPGTATPSRTVFALQRRFGCLWLRL